MKVNELLGLWKWRLRNFISISSRSYLSLFISLASIGFFDILFVPAFAQKGLSLNGTPAIHPSPSAGGLQTEPGHFNPFHAKVRCDYLPTDFIECEKLVDHKGNSTARDKLGYGCVKVRILKQYTWLNSVFDTWLFFYIVFSGAEIGTRK